MQNIFSNAELEEALMSKKVDDIYFVILQQRSDDYLYTCFNGEFDIDIDKIEYDPLDEVRGNYISDPEELPSSRKNLFILAVRVGDYIYDFIWDKLIDFNVYRVVNFVKASKYYSDDNMRVGKYSREELYDDELGIFCQFDDETEYQNIRRKVDEPITGIDRTKEFLEEMGFGRNR